MTLAPRPPWDPAMANGCSTPKFAQVADWALRKACEVSREACNRHDLAYYLGGSLDAKLDADIELYGDVLHDLLRAGETWADAQGTAAAMFRGLQTPIALAHWYRPPTVERSPQEA